MKVLVLLCLGAVCVQARIGTKCRTVSHCDQGECCQILSPFLIASRKRQLADILLPPDEEGTCQRFRTQGESCGVFEEVNGYCSCGPGLRCQGEEVKINDILNPPVRRAMVALRPGYTWVYTCKASPVA